MYDQRYLKNLSISQLTTNLCSAHIKELMRRGYPYKSIAKFYGLPLEQFMKVKDLTISDADAKRAIEYAKVNGLTKQEKELRVPTLLEQSILDHIAANKGLKENDLADYVPSKLAKTEDEISEAVHQLVGHGKLVCVNYNMPGESLSGRFLLPKGSDTTVVKAAVADGK